MDSTQLQGCWVDLFEKPRLRGRRRRLFGPGRFPSLRARLPDWGVGIQSLQAGPAAYVRLYRSDPDADQPPTVLWLLPGQAGLDLKSIDNGEHVDSLDFDCQPPVEGAAGYDQYLLAVEHMKNSRRC